MRCLILSNGHGEDVVGARLYQALAARQGAWQYAAFPVVGRGAAYQKLALEVLGPRQQMPSGGLTLHSVAYFVQDMRAGLLPMTAAQLRALKTLEADVLLVVGDAFALALSMLIRASARFYVQTLVSVRQQEAVPSRINRYFMEGFRGPELMLMRRAAQVYVRDAPSAAYLQARQIPAQYLGNPMFDALAAEKPLPEAVLAASGRPKIALLPGSRGYSPAALEKMLEVMKHVPEALGLIAWHQDTPPKGLGVAWQALGAGWYRGSYQGSYRGSERLFLACGAFNEILAAADMVLGTAGTAHEQAAMQQKPVVSFPVASYTRAFLANQQRLLGDALTVCPPEPPRIAAAVRALWQDAARFKAAAEAGRRRMGGGGAEAIVQDIALRVAAEIL